ncbi:alpha-glycosidase [Paenibacillus roseipurpureus]|uniref:Alpha-glycosidase n=1 Tax=Paenibacillus roseopurpureus TaxID=2918901 RepID=A0AA96LTM8_9BACL|nr:alpha-glycosidase [Paenibacillus sp. MBLB1832]WNR47131.1 alpha-glycosidase [Paenibacillus sp. MBLB1832]
MVIEAVYHRPKLNWSYAYDDKTVHVRIRTKRNNVSKMFVYAGDKYAWERTSSYIEMRILTSDALFDYWEAAIQPPYRRLRYGFKLQSGKETLWLTEQGFHPQEPKTSDGMFEYPFLNPADILKPPSWVKDAVFYQIFPERFANGDPSLDPAEVEAWGGKPTPTNFFGGDLPGVMQHLDHLSELGITAIYFTPVFAATTNHKYDTRDYKLVDPQFGTNETLKELVDACHARGIRVVLDAVFNHCGHSFAPFVDVMEKGADSPYADWFHVKEWPLRIEDGIPTYETFAFEPIMPKLNTENEDVKAYLLDVAEFWVKEIGIDGWRLDVANEVDHRFWRLFHDKVKGINPDAYILGEIWHDSMMWLQGDQFDAVMNYPFTTAVLDFAANGKLDGYGFANAVGSQLASYPQQANEAAFNLLGSHDTPRLLTQCGEDKRRMKLATLLQFTFPGTPCIYYGDEIGLSGGGDPDCRRCMEWDASLQDRDLFAFYRGLIALRQGSKALRTGALRFLHAKPGDARLVLERVHEDGEHLLIFVNASRRSAQLSVKGLGERRWRDALGGDAAPEASGGHLRLRLPAYGYAVLRAE